MSKFVSDENLRQFKTNLDDVYVSKAAYQTNIYKTTYTFQKRVNSGGTLQDAQISPNPQNIKAGDLVYDGNGTIASFEHDYQTNSNLAYVLYISNVKVQIFKTTTTLSKTYNFSNAVNFNTLQPDNGNGIKVGDIIVDKFGTIAIVGAVDVYVDASTRISNDFYTKPTDGIPKSDLAQAVQTSLGKADTALQSAPVTSVNGKTGVVTLSATDVNAATITQVNETSMVPDSGNATNLTVPESGGRVEIDVDGWLCVSVSKTTANGQYITMIVQKEDGTDKWGCVNKSTTYFQNNYPAEFLPVKKGDYVRISYNIKPSRIQLIRSKQV